MAGRMVKFTPAGRTDIVTSRASDTLDLAIGHALDLERQKHSIEGIIGPNGETFDRQAYAELRRKKLNGK
jgi:hypothetical protein